MNYAFLYRSLTAILIISVIHMQYCKGIPLDRQVNLLRQRRTLRERTIKLDCNDKLKEQCIELSDRRLFCRTVKVKAICVDNVFD